MTSFWVLTPAHVSKEESGSPLLWDLWGSARCLHLLCPHSGKAVILSLCYII